MKKYLLVASIIGIILIAYRGILTPGTLTNTDLPYWNSSNLLPLPFVWDMQRGSGTGGFYAPFLWYFLPITLPFRFLLDTLHISWEIVVRVVLFLPLFILGGGGSFLLVRQITKSWWIGLLGPILFFFNSYVVLLLSGGQVQMALGFSCLILVTLSLVLSTNFGSILEKKIGIILFPFSLALLLWYELRVFVLGLGIVGLFTLLQFIFAKNKKQIMYLFGGMFLFSTLFLIVLNAFWYIPVLLHKTDPIKDLGKAFYSVEALKYFSFATIEYPFALHHPFWPENIFGKMSFFSPLFLLLPFSALLFLSLSKQEKNTKVLIIFSLVLILLGSFFGKGVQDPFGQIFQWLFFHIPGFSLFRDPSKFFMLVLVGYMILFPLSIYLFSKEKSQKIKACLFIYAVFILTIPTLHYLLFTPTGAIKSREVPQWYQKSGEVIKKDASFYRTLWYPSISIFSYYSFTHPAIPAVDYFETYSLSSLHNKMKNSVTEQRIKESAIRYIIVPKDTEGTIFTQDRKYSPKLEKETYATLDSLSWLKKIEKEGVILYEVDEYKHHIWSAQGEIAVTSASPVSYTLDTSALKTEPNREIYFSEMYDPFWEIEQEGITKKVEKTEFNTMKFTISPDSSSSLKLHYTLQNYTKLLPIGLLLAFVIYSIYSLIIWKKIR